MTTATVFNNCIGKLATVCQANDLILQKMLASGEFPKDQVDLARSTALKSGNVLNRLIFNYLMRL
jgi:hypothetical protein